MLGWKYTLQKYVIRTERQKQLYYQCYSFLAALLREELEKETQVFNTIVEAANEPRARSW